MESWDDIFYTPYSAIYMSILFYFIFLVYLFGYLGKRLREEKHALSGVYNADFKRIERFWLACSSVCFVDILESEKLDNG